MTKERINELIGLMPEYVPVRLIERHLGMPKTTLQKVLKGQRELPKKWEKPLEAYFGVILKVNPIPQKLKNYQQVIANIPPEIKKEVSIQMDNLEIEAQIEAIKKEPKPSVFTTVKFEAYQKRRIEQLKKQIK